MTQDILLTPDDVADIVAILDGTPYERIDIATSRFSLRVARSGQGWTQEWDINDGGKTAPEISAPISEIAREADDGSLAVHSPLPGTFYRAPQPGAKAFVEVGDTVTPDTVIGIVETMKLMNSVQAGIAGTVGAILTADGTQVDLETILMRIAPGSS